MERSLIIGAILLLFLEIGLLLTGLDDVPTWAPRSNLNNGRVIGQMNRTESNVRRRALSSLVWEESQTHDPLYEFDSVLTLSGSAAQIQFNSKTTLNIDENTLIVLEETPDRENGSLRVRFSRGLLRSKNPRHGIEINNDTWTLTAEEGSVVNLVGLNDGRFDLELSEGQAHLRSQDGVQDISRGERLLIRDSRIEERKHLTTELKWDESSPSRLYSHEFPVKTELKWHGEAEFIHLITPERTEKKIPLENLMTGHFLELNEGTYLVSLTKADRVSETRLLQVRKAPLFRYYSPLPRDRIKTGSEPIFSWEPTEFATQYRLEVSPSKDFSTGVRTWKSETPIFKTQLAEEGAFFWRVIGLDENKTPIPEPRIYPLFMVPDPLDSPELHTPKIRRPASPLESSDESKPRSGASLVRRWWALLVPSASAQNEAHGLEALFTWSSIEGADHYIIEISKSHGFEDPVVIQRTSEPRFLWRGFEKGMYFWRVAAGRSGNENRAEQLGLFSPMAVAHLENPEVFAGEGVTVFHHKPVTKKPRAKPTPPPKATAPIEEPPPETPTEPPAPRQEEEGKWRKNLTWLPSYRSTEMRGSEGIIGLFSGPSAIAFEADVDYVSPRSFSWLLRLGYDETEWKPKNPKDTPFQSAVKERRFNADLFFKKNPSRWSFGLGAESLPVFKRKAPEEGELSSVTVFGPSVIYQYLLNERHGLDTVFTARFGELSGAKLETSWRMQVAKTGYTAYTFAPTASYGYFQGADIKLGDWRLGARFSLGW